MAWRAKELPATRRLHKFFDYNPETGAFTWRIKRTKNAKAGIGAQAGTLGSDGYWRVELDGKFYRVHRLIFRWMGKKIPEEVDHLNGIRHDNRWKNLRAADALSNAKNAKQRSDGKFVLTTGVSWSPKMRKWRVRIGHSGKVHELGNFESSEEACATRHFANLLCSFHENHGRVAV